MHLGQRLAFLLRADAHGVVDRLEDRSLLLKQALRDAEDALHQRRRTLALIDEEDKGLAQRVARQQADLAALDADVSLSLKEGKEELARFAIRRLLPQRRALAADQGRRAALAVERNDLATAIVRQEQELEELRVQVQAALASLARGDDGLAAAAAPAVEEEVELELLRRRAAQTGGA